jgi:hypothetical protein
MDKVRKPNISVCYTPSSEPYSIYSSSNMFIFQNGESPVAWAENFGKKRILCACNRTCIVVIENILVVYNNFYRNMYLNHALANVIGVDLKGSDDGI